MAARAGSAAPDNTAHDWAIESIRHSSLSFEPSQVPSSNVARRYHSPSQASRSSASRSLSAWARQRRARSESRPSASGANSSMVRSSSQPSQTLSPLPPSPTRFMPSFQSPPPISGRPCSPVSSRHWSRPRAQCSNSEADSSAICAAEEGVVLARAQARAFEKRHDLIENRGVARAGDIGRGRKGEPDPIVRDARPHALSGMRQPPMLNVAFDELPGGGAQEMAPRLVRRGEGQRHAVLKLVAEAVGAARLIEGGARQDAAGERLIEQPAVQHDVHGAVGRLDLDRARAMLSQCSSPRRERRRDRPRGSGR